MKKRFIAIISLLLVLLFAIPFISSDNKSAMAFKDITKGYRAIDYSLPITEISSDSAIVIDGKSKSVLFKKNENAVCGMASTTKIMTALVAIENCDPEREFLMPKEAVGIEGSSVYLKENEPLTMRELLYCLMLESGNDAATAIAICCSGSIEGFVDLMNERAIELGLKDTKFVNPHGLSDVNHKTTAFELAIITATAYEYPLFCEIVSTKTKSVRLDGIENGRRLVNHNKLLFGYEGTLGVKTGYTMADGKCLVSAAEREGLFLIAVTLRDDSPTATHRKLLDSCFESFCQARVCDESELDFQIPVENGESEFLSVSNQEAVSICLPKGEDFEIELLLPDSIKAPIQKGEIIGKAICKNKENKVYIINIESQQEIKEKRKSILELLFGEKK